MQVRTKDCRHGRMSFIENDEFVGRSLDLYGEYSEQEVAGLAKVVRPGDTVIDVGANIGAITVPLARMVGADGMVYAVEPHPTLRRLLIDNCGQSGVGTNVFIIAAAASSGEGTAYVPGLDKLGNCNFGRVEINGDRAGIEVKTVTIDSLKIRKCKLIKIDVEGHELEVLKGAEETIKTCRPFIYVENDRPENSCELIAWLVDHGYRLFWHRPPLFNPLNHHLNQRNVFGGIISINMFALPEELGFKVVGAEEVADIRPDSQMYVREAARFARILARDEKDLEARFKMAHYLNLQQRTSEARAALDYNLRLDPDHIPTKAVKAMLDLQAGDWISGWPGYELRLQQPNPHTFGVRPRDGEPWDGKETEDVVCLWSEQGFGDSIMFARFIRMALERAPNSFVEVQPQLYELFETSHLVGPDRLFRLGRSMPTYSKHCSLPSLPATLGITKDQEIRCSPYLRADKTMTDSWLRRGTPRIGFCWQGSPRSERPYSRDIDPELMRPVTNRFGPFLNLVQDGQFESFADTASAIMSLNLVITVDTAIAHLAGALGVPTWLLLSFDPDWRWGLRESRCVWYDNMHIFRQPRMMDWEAVIKEVNVEFEKHIADAA